ncbi:glutathione S-transferase [Undibacterium luofuense]|uniref:glutathione S-transferase family protein n=1 Tax=Undibacterium luofuense TaxID=2828733 RepID=UPI0030EEEF50
MLKLLGKSSSINVRKVLWTLDELGLAYEQQQYGSGFAAVDTPEFLALNPNGMVPVLMDGDFVLWESNTICRYLVQKQGDTTLLPADLQARAKTEQWMDWQATELNNAWRYAFMSLVRQSPAHQDQVALATGIQQWNRMMAIVDAQLQKTGAYISGSEFTLADIVIGLSVQRWMMTPIERAQLSAVAAYYELLSQRPAFLKHGRNGLP